MDGEANGSWPSVPLGEVAELIMGQAPAGATVAEWDGAAGIERGLPFIQGNAEFGPRFPSPVKWCSQPSKIALPGDYLISVRAPVGELNEVNTKLAIGRGLAAIRFRSVHDRFGWQALWRARGEFARVAQGSTFDAINSRDLAGLLIPCPPEPVQISVARTLDAIDEAIGTTEAVIAATENLRKALLQELLTRGVPGWHTEWKTVPGIGTIPACWEVVRLGEVAQVRNGTTPSKARADFWSAQGFPFIRTGQVNDRVITRGEQFLTEAGLRNRAVVVPKGSVLIAMIGQGKTRGMAAKLAVTAAINQNFAAVTTLDRLDSNYFYTWADHNYEGLRGLGQGSNQGALNCGLIASMPVPLPTIPEQRHIAESVAAIDSRGAAEQHHLDSLKHAKDLWADTLLSGRVRIPTRKVAP